MAQIIDTATNTKVVYLFVNSFQWVFDIDKETSVGHPKSGILYRAVKNIDTESYRIVYKIDDTIQGIMLPTLDNKEEVKGYVADISEVTLENILDFKISDKDLKDFLKWLEDDNKDVKEWMSTFFKKQTTKSTTKADSDLPEILRKLQNKTFPEMVVEMVRARDPELASIISMISDLREENPAIYAALGSFVTHILTQKPEAESPINDYWIRFDENLGAGANLSAAVAKLSVYGSSDRRTNLHEKDLLGAVTDLLLEQHRRNLNDLK